MYCIAQISDLNPGQTRMRVDESSNSHSHLVWTLMHSHMFSLNLNLLKFFLSNIKSFLLFGLSWCMESSYGRMGQGWPAKTMVKTLMEDTGAETMRDLAMLMEERAACQVPWGGEGVRSSSSRWELKKTLMRANSHLTHQVSNILPQSPDFLF